MSNTVNVDFITKVIEIEFNDKEEDVMASQTAINSAARAKEAENNAKKLADSSAEAAIRADQVATALTDIYNEAIEEGTIVAPAVDKTIAISGAAADAYITGNIFRKTIARFNFLSPYFYKDNIYIDDNGQEAALSGYTTYRVPVVGGDLVTTEQMGGNFNYWGSLTRKFIYNVQLADTSFVQTETQKYSLLTLSLGASKAVILIPANAVYLYITVKTEYAYSLKINRNNAENVLYGTVVDKKDFVYKPSNLGMFLSVIYRYSDNEFHTLVGDIKAYVLRLNRGDKVELSKLPSGVDFGFCFTDSSTLVTTASPTGSLVYTLPSDGIIFAFVDDNERDALTAYPKNAINIDGSIGNFNGRTGVAFGTSLTYNSSVSYGYLSHLSALSGITFDNQGIGSSFILGNMLTAIKEYTGYADKDVCVLEGFVNDWYNNKTLGTWQDTEETTVCGCVRSALNYILSQNPDLTVFLILDHYGRNSGGIDCSTTSKRSGNLTQYEYYNEIAKVAESLGVPVIKEYELSQISENTPQYLRDNIHLNALGAQQSANAIWSVMKQFYPNVK